EFEPVLLDLYTHIDNSLELLINTAKEKNISINQNISQNIFLYADKEMLSVIIRNLISNAIKFTHKGGEIKIYTKINRDKPADQFVEITVEDNGKGMNDDSLGKLFQIDQNISSKGTEGEKGTGLGLVLCKEFIEKHEGTIHVESEVEKGSKFIVTLPIN
ncbi:MAG: hybrid sensor histidine kinase/response regulator, partial [Bacteroidetes bacterium]